VEHLGAEHSWERRVGRRTLTPRVILQIAAILVVIVVAYRERHLFTGFGAIMSDLTWYWVGLAFAAELASIPPLAEAQLIVLRAGGTRPRRWRMNLVTLASNAVSMSVPAGVAVAEGYTYSRYRRLGATPAVAAWAELASGALAFAALAAMALAGAIVAGGPAGRVLLPLLSVVLAGSFAAAALFRHPHILIAAVNSIERRLGNRLGPLVARGARRAREMSQELVFDHPTPLNWAAAFWLSTVNWLLDAACLALCFKAVGGTIPWGATLLAFAGSKVVSSVGITPGGLGVVEGGLVATFVAYGTSGPTTIAAVLVYRTLTFIGLVGIGWVAVAMLSGKPPRAARVGPG
jgi:putative heme transporter